MKYSQKLHFGNGQFLKDFEVEIILMNISNAYEHTLSLFAIVTLLCMFKCKEAAIPRLGRWGLMWDGGEKRGAETLSDLDFGIF